MRTETTTTTPAPVDLLLIEFLYLDLSTCQRCRGTDEVLSQALELSSPALEAMGLAAEIRKVHVQSEDQAIEEDFVASPTIRVNGVDIHPEILLNSCKDCGDLCGCAEGVDCRVWRYRGEEFTEPPVSLVVEAIMAAAVGRRTPGTSGTAPVSERARKNMQKYFANTTAEREQDVCCATDCCSGTRATE